MSVSVSKALKQNPLRASAPCRIDVGGTWDIKAMALPMEGIEPATINAALNLRTWVSLSPLKDGWIGVSSEGFPRTERYPIESLPFNSTFGLFFAAVSYFGFHGLQIHIRSDSPVQSALGGSSTALIALLKALSNLSRLLGGESLSRRRILHLGYHLEDGMGRGNCGIQDQAAAVYGGVNLWKWTYGDRNSIFKRDSLLDIRGKRELSKRILVAYSGRSHSSARINRSWVKDFLSGTTRKGWMEANEIVLKLAEAIKIQDWSGAAGLLRDEMDIRRKITPDALIPVTEKLIDQAEAIGCGARFTGAGSGGSLWALGEVEQIRDLKMIWERTLTPIQAARILDCAVESIGVR